MQTFLLRIEDSYINSLMEFIKPIPKEYFEMRNLNFEIDSEINFFEDELAYLVALNDLEKGNTIELNEYLEQRGLS